MSEEPVQIDYSLNEYSDLLEIRGRCTLGRKTVYGIYIYTREYAKRRNYCGLYILEECMKDQDKNSGKVMKFPINFIELILSRLFDSTPSRRITELVFCDMYRCYPTPLGIYPLTRLLESQASMSLRRDVLTEFMKRFGSVNVIDYIFYRTPARVFYLSVMFPRKKVKYIIIIPTPDPELHAVNVGKLQLLAKKAIPQLENLVLGLKTGNDMDGLRALGISSPSSTRRTSKNIYESEQHDENES